MYNTSLDSDKLYEGSATETSIKIDPNGYIIKHHILLQFLADISATIHW